MTVPLTRTLRAALAYFGLVFGTGFILGAFRVTLLVPRLGIRTAELLEMPLMLVATIVAARTVVRRFGLPAGARSRLPVGILALALLITAELVLAALLAGESPREWLTGRDPVSGPVYFGLLILFAAMPALLRQGLRDHD